TLITFLIDHWATQEMAPFIGDIIINSTNNPNEPYEKRFKNYDTSNLLPCKAELKQQILRTQYITSIWQNAHLRFPSTLAPTRNGWDLQDGKFEFYWFEGDCMPLSIMDASKAENRNEKQNTMISEDIDEITAYSRAGHCYGQRNYPLLLTNNFRTVKIHAKKNYIQDK
ncbi:Protein of unknown function, partial [Cotesia congregata]